MKKNNFVINNIVEGTYYKDGIMCWTIKADTINKLEEEIYQMQSPSLHNELTKSKLTNCTNCSAPLHYEGNYCKCKYCETEYY